MSSRQSSGDVIVTWVVVVVFDLSDVLLSRRSALEREHLPYWPLAIGHWPPLRLGRMTVAAPRMSPNTNVEPLPAGSRVFRHESRDREMPVWVLPRCLGSQDRCSSMAESETPLGPEPARVGGADRRQSQQARRGGAEP